MIEKDTFQILADEITLIRHDMERLHRTSLNKDEAKALNQELAKGVKQMANAAPEVYEAISARLDLAIDKIRREAVTAAREATSGAIEKSHAASLFVAKDLAKAAGEARREAWRYFGGFLGVANLYRRCWGPPGRSGGVLAARSGGRICVWQPPRDFLHCRRRKNRHQRARVEVLRHVDRPTALNRELTLPSAHFCS